MHSRPASVCSRPEALGPLFDYLQAQPGPAPLEGLLRALEALTLTPEDVAEHIRFSAEPGVYARNPIGAAPGRYQVLLICWKPGDASPIHDHAGSACAVRVVDGAGAETTYRLLAGNLVRPAAVRPLEAGMVLGSRDADVHRVAAGPAALVTLHVYAPGLDLGRVRKDFVVAPGEESR